MYEILAYPYDLVGRLLAPLINWATEFLTAYVTVDLAKAATVVGLFVTILLTIKTLENAFSNWIARATTVICLFIILTAGVTRSDDHITRDSFWFGNYVELIEKYL